MRPESIVFLEGKIGSKLFDINLSNIFFLGEYILFQVKITKSKISKWDYIKLKNLLQSEENHEQNKKVTH